MSAPALLRRMERMPEGVRLLVFLVVVGLLCGLALLAWVIDDRQRERQVQQIAAGIRPGWSEEEVEAHLGAAPDTDSREGTEKAKQTGQFKQRWWIQGQKVEVNFRREQVIAVQVNPED